MAKSITEVYSPSTISKSKFELNSWFADPAERLLTKNSLTLAPKFKYQEDCLKEDIDEIRRLLQLERVNQNEDEFNFWSSDFERMMRDDWLVSRFLLRGIKASKKLGPQNEDAKYSCTMQLLKACAKFRFDYRINGTTKLSEFPIEWTHLNGLFSYKPDLAGNPTIYLRIKLHKPKLIETKELRHEFKRLLLYTLECCDRELSNQTGKAICCVFDMSGATFENVDLELVSWMIKSFKSSSPKLLCYAIIYNLPWFFSATFKLVSSTLMSSGNKQSLRFVYGDEILKYISHENLPNYLQATLG